MKNYFYFIFLIFYSNTTLGQAFITLDNETNEFIEDVEFSLFFKDKMVFNGLTENKKITQIDDSIEYDSISLSRIDYYPLGLQKEKIDSILYMTKKIIYLDEVVIDSKKDSYIFLGETNRFVKKQSRSIRDELIYGIIHDNKSNKKVEIEKIVFFTERVFHKTAYKINFYNVKETTPKGGNQFAEIGNLIYSTDTLYLDKKTKNKVELDINSEIQVEPAAQLFVSIQLLNYLDDSNNIINPNNEKLTKLKFQLSNKTNYYSKTMDLFSKEMSSDFLNINLMINYDFANEFFLKPHKSILVSPAIILYGGKNVE